MTIPDRSEGKLGQKRLMTRIELSLDNIFGARKSQLESQLRRVRRSKKERQRLAPWAKQEIEGKLREVRRDWNDWARGLNNPENPIE